MWGKPLSRVCISNCVLLCAVGPITFSCQNIRWLDMSPHMGLNFLDFPVQSYAVVLHTIILWRRCKKSLLRSSYWQTLALVSVLIENDNNIFIHLRLKRIITMGCTLLCFFLCGLAKVKMPYILKVNNLLAIKCRLTWGANLSNMCKCIGWFYNNWWYK